MRCYPEIRPPAGGSGSGSGLAGSHPNDVKHPAHTPWIGLLAGCLLAGCLEGAGGYLRQDGNAAIPRALDVLANDASSIRAIWTREQPLGLEGSVAATLLDPAVGRAILAIETRDRRSAGVLDTMALQSWQRWYAGGRTLPVLVRWRFDRNFHAEAITDPAQWQLALVADDRTPIAPLRWGRVTRQDDDEAWAGSFTVWFPWHGADGRPAMGHQPRRLRLLVSGSPGRAELQWRFAPLLTDMRTVPWGPDPW